VIASRSPGSLIAKLLAASSATKGNPLRGQRPRRDQSGRFQRVVNALQETTRNALSNLREIRGSHVHRRRFDDPDLSDVEKYDLLAAEDDPQRRWLWALQRRRAYEQACKQWVKIIRNNNKAVDQWVERYFSILHDYVFDREDKVIGA
jgi:hypothetical protein